MINNKIKGVKLDNQKEINADNVVCNADPPAVYDKILNQVTNGVALRMALLYQLLTFNSGSTEELAI